MTSLDPDHPKRLVPRLLEAGVRAPQVLLEAAVEAQTGSAESTSRACRRATTRPTWKHWSTR